MFSARTRTYIQKPWIVTVVEIFLNRARINPFNMNDEACDGHFAGLPVALIGTETRAVHNVRVARTVNHRPRRNVLQSALIDEINAFHRITRSAHVKRMRIITNRHARFDQHLIQHALADFDVKRKFIVASQPVQSRIFVCLPHCAGLYAAACGSHSFPCFFKNTADRAARMRKVFIRKPPLQHPAKWDRAVRISQIKRQRARSRSAARTARRFQHEHGTSLTRSGDCRRRSRRSAPCDDHVVLRQRKRATSHIVRFRPSA